LAVKNQDMNLDVIVIGSGIGGLTAAAILARYGKQVLVCESHAIAGGAAHSFVRRGFTFDSGPSFYCGLSDSQSLNPLRQVFDLLEESIPTVTYDPLGYYHFPEGTFPVYSKSEKYRAEVAKITPRGARELEQFERRLLALYDGLKEIPAIALRADWQIIPILIGQYLPSLVKLLPQLGLIQCSVGDVMNREVKDAWVRRLIDLECFLLSGLKAEGTIAPEVAFMLGERDRIGVDYPIGGSGAIVDALVRGLKRWGGKICLNAHVDRIIIESGKVAGIKLQNGEVIPAPIVISNATVWDTYTKLLSPADLPNSYRQKSLETPAVESFMHVHLGIRAEGLEGLIQNPKSKIQNPLAGHHVVVHDSNRDISEPGNTCMISIPSVWDKNLAPEGHHVVHAYTLEPYDGWQRDDDYNEKKKKRSQPLFQALEKVIPDIRERIVLELIGTPLTHAYYLRRYQGTYGPAIAAKKGMFPSTHTPIPGLYRVGDSTLPGIGVPAVAASGILCANTLAG
jgi:carotene isomerase